MFRILLAVLNLSIVLGITLTIGVVYSTFYKRKIEDFITNEWLIVILLVIGISSLFYIVFQLKGIIKTLIIGNPFVRLNVIAFKKISISSLLKNNKAKAVRFSTLEAICKELNCQPGDILEFVND